MATALEDLRILQAAEAIADDLWKQVGGWERFARETVGSQLVRAVDSIGANIAEAFGRYHYGERLQFIYYARGSLFESKYWLNRASTRGLIASGRAGSIADQLTNLARQLNTFAASLKSQRRADSPAKQKRVQEQAMPYNVADAQQAEGMIFTQQDLEWLSNIPTSNEP